MGFPGILLADETLYLHAPWHAKTLGEALLATSLFGLLGIILVLLGFKIFDWITPKLDLEHELREKNIAVAIVIAAMVLGVSWITVTAMG